MTDKSKFSDLIEARRREILGDRLVTASRLWLQVGDIMGSDVETIGPDQTIASAAKIMTENNISCLVVIDKTKVTGIITETDFLKRTSTGDNNLDKVKVADIMSSPVESIPPDFSILEASRIAIDKHIKRLPILNRDGQLVGIVTQSDLIRSLKSYGMWWNVSDIMNSDVAVIDHKATVANAMEIMTNRNISCIVVLQGDQTAGVFTKRDLVKKVTLPGKDSTHTKIEDVMSSPAINVPFDCSVFSANRIMDKMNIRRLLCMDDKRLCGIVTQTDIFLAMKNKLEAEEEKNIHILIIDDDLEDMKILQHHLNCCRKGAVKSEHALDLEQALEKLNHRHFDLVFLKNKPGDIETAGNVLKNLRKEKMDIPVIIITGHGDQQTAVELMKMGAYDYITKDKFTPDLIEKTVRATAEHSLELLTRELEEKVKERTAKLTVEVADRKKAEHSLELLTKELEMTIKKLTIANAELQDFAHIAAHDLKAPLRAIVTLANWLATDYSDKFDEEGRKNIQILVGRTVRMSNHIDNILRYSELGHTEVMKESVNLNRLIEEIIRDIAPPENITITINSELPTISGDKARMTQVFQNLLTNAIKYMDKPQGQITIDYMEEGNFWKFSVADNGPGIKRKYFDRIFKIFQTLAPRDEVESTGIGLSIVKKIVELYHGKVWVESKVGEGTTFFFTLLKQESEVPSDAELQTNVVS